MIGKINVMDKIWVRKSEVIGRLAGMKTPKDHTEPTKVERQKQKTKQQ